MKSGFLQIVRRFAGFSASSLAGTLVDTLIIWLLADYAFSSEWAQFYLTPFISFECACLANFTLAYFYVWKDRISHRSLRSFLRHYAGYNGSCTLSFLVKLAFLALIHILFPTWHPVVCNLLALCCSGTMNFCMSEWVVFRRKNQ